MNPPSVEATSGLDAADDVIGEPDVPREASVGGSIRPSPVAVVTGGIALLIGPRRRTTFLHHLGKRVTEHDQAPAANQAVVWRGSSCATTFCAHTCDGRPTCEEREERQERNGDNSKVRITERHVHTGPRRRTNALRYPDRSRCRLQPTSLRYPNYHPGPRWPHSWAQAARSPRKQGRFRHPDP